MSDAATLFDRPVAGIVRALRERRVRSRDLVAEALTRIRRRNPLVNAVLTFRRASDALAEAEAADARLDAGAPAGPIDGLPVTIKDMFDTAGIRTTFGALHYRDRVPETDAPIVARWREGGAIVVAKTSAPEFGFSPECDNLLVGRTSNPFDWRRTSGGSSGGEGALLAAGASVMGLGSDISGSLRTPAHFCGVASLMPTHGWISNEGHYPVLDPLSDSMLVAGPMARRVEDLEVAWDALTGTPGSGTHQGPWRVAVHGLSDPLLSARCRLALDQAIRALGEAGHEVEPVDLGALRRAHELWERILLADGGASLRRTLEDGRRFFLPLELVRSALGHSGRSDMLLWAIAILGRRRPTSEDEIARARASLVADVEPHLGPARAILMPVTPGTAHRHWSLGHSLAVFRYIRLANVLGLPAVVAPVLPGRSSRELPAGVQLVGAPGMERDLISLARAIEPPACP